MSLEPTADHVKAMPIHLEKKAIRALGVAESFKKGLSHRSALAGVVMRSDLVVDGFVFGSAEVGGDDATNSIVGMFEKLGRNDINVIMLGGAVISMYNIIDIDAIGMRTNTPVISVTFEESAGLEEHIKRHFPSSWEGKLAAYKKLGGREEVKLRTGHVVYVRACQISSDMARRVLDKFTLQGAIPEPIRLARLLARAKLSADEGEEH